jgi:hypothetical protein
MLLLLLVSLVFAVDCDPFSTVFTSACSFPGSYVLPEIDVLFAARVDVAGDLVIGNKTKVTMRASPNTLVGSIHVNGTVYINSDAVFAWESNDLEFLSRYSLAFPAIGANSVPQGTFGRFYVGGYASEGCVVPFVKGKQTSTKIFVFTMLMFVFAKEISTEFGFFAFVTLDDSNCTNDWGGLGVLAGCVLGAAALVLVIYIIVKCVRRRKDAEMQRIVNVASENDFNDRA